MNQLSVAGTVEKRKLSVSRPDHHLRHFRRDLDLCRISDRPLRSDRFQVVVYEDMVQVRRYAKTGADGNGDGYRRSGGGQRGAITTFSRASRKRMIDAMCQRREYDAPKFLTLTYPDEVWFSDQSGFEAVKRDIAVFRKRMMRRYPEAACIWRLELQTRKSGEFTGSIAPHYHLLCDNINDDLENFYAWAVIAWDEVIGASKATSKKVQVHATMVKSRRHAMYYVSKYLGKEAHGDIVTMAAGRYGFVGRQWGVFGAWDRAPYLETILTREQMVQVRRECRKMLLKRGQKFGKTLGRHGSRHGYSVYGLGWASNPRRRKLNSAIARMIERAVFGTNVPILASRSHVDKRNILV